MGTAVEPGSQSTVGDATDKLVHGGAERPPFRLPRTAPSDLLESIVLRVNYVAALLWALLVLTVVVAVTLRYVFGRGSVMLEEIQWHIFGIGFILALSYALVTDRHVRIDVLAERLPPRTRAWIELGGLLVFLIPFCLAVILEAVPFVLRSYRLNEVSAAPGGLPYRWIAKSFIIWGFSLLLLAAAARLLRVTALLFGWPMPKPRT